MRKRWGVIRRSTEGQWDCQGGNRTYRTYRTRLRLYATPRQACRLGVRRFAIILNIIFCVTAIFQQKQAVSDDIVPWLPYRATQHRPL